MLGPTETPSFTNASLVREGMVNREKPAGSSIRFSTLAFEKDERGCVNNLLSSSMVSEGWTCSNESESKDERLGEREGGERWTWEVTSLSIGKRRKSRL